MALGVLQALEEAGRSATVVGANATPDGIALIKSGRLLASAAFDAMSMATLAGEAALRHLAGEKVPRQITLPAQLVDRNNCADWDKDYGLRTPVSWQQAVGGSSIATG